jgi:hypothetical protein
MYAAGREPLHPGADIRHVVRMAQVFHHDPGQFLGHTAEHLGHSPVHLHNPGVQIDNGHAQLPVFEHTPEPFLALAQEGLGPLSLRDLLEQADNGADPSPVANNVRRGRQ